MVVDVVEVVGVVVVDVIIGPPDACIGIVEVVVGGGGLVGGVHCSKVSH